MDLEQLQTEADKDLKINDIELDIESLKRLKSVFQKNGTVTAGNSSGINDGAAAVVLMNEDRANKKGLKKLVRIKSWASCGVDPALMGTGPIPSSCLLYTSPSPRDS